MLVFTGGLVNAIKGLEFSHLSPIHSATCFAVFLLVKSRSGANLRRSAGDAQAVSSEDINKIRMIFMIVLSV